MTLLSHLLVSKLSVVSAFSCMAVHAKYFTSASAFADHSVVDLKGACVFMKFVLYADEALYTPFAAAVYTTESIVPSCRLKCWSDFHNTMYCCICCVVVMFRTDLIQFLCFISFATDLFLNIATRNNSGSLCMSGLSPSHVSCQNKVVSPFPIVILVFFAKKSLSVAEHGMSSPCHGFS